MALDESCHSALGHNLDCTRCFRQEAGQEVLNAAQGGGAGMFFSSLEEESFTALQGGLLWSPLWPNSERCLQVVKPLHWSHWRGRG